MSGPIPAFINPNAGSAAAARDALASDARFALREVDPESLAGAIRAEVRRGVRRIVVAGGDGTLRVAAGELLQQPVELAVVPGGTWNHFAKSLGLGVELERALDVAAGGEVRGVDVGMVGDRVFLNTSSVGAYVSMVRRRERARPRLGYHGAAAVAAASLFARLRTFTLELDIHGERNRYRTPLIFFGVGERDLRLRSFGERVPGGPSALHAVLVRGKGRARLLAVALATAGAGIWRVARTPHVDSFMVESCLVDLPRPRVSVALDGEIVRLPTPLRYRIVHRALRVVAPEAKNGTDSADVRAGGGDGWR